MTTSLKIISLQAENIKRLVAVRIDPTGNMVQLTGKNAQGKTSVLDCIYLALKVAGIDLQKPVREGEERGSIRLDLGEIVVLRKFKFDKETGETTTSIKVTAADGAKYDSPQGMLDKLLSSLTFDPLEFSRLDPAAQVKAVRGLMPEIDFEGVTAANKVDFDARTEVNRKVRDLKGEIAAMPPAPASIPARVDKTALVQQLSDASAANGVIETKKANRATATAKMAENLVDIADLEQKIADMKEWNEAKTKAIADAGPLPALVDSTALAAQINEADANNAIIDAAEARTAKEEALDAKEREADRLTQQMTSRLEVLQVQVAAAKLPVAGLAFSDDGLLFNGIPFTQASDAERLRTSIAIAMSQNPKLKVIRVREGSLLDEDGLALLEKMAQENDYQVWIERVDSSGKIGFVLENGHLKGQDLTPTPAETPKATKVAKPKPAPIEPPVALSSPKPALTPGTPQKDVPVQDDLL